MSWPIVFGIFEVNPLNMRFWAISWSETTTNVPHEGKLDNSLSICQNVTDLESWNPRAGGPVWVRPCRDSATVNSLSPCGGLEGRAETGCPFCSLFWSPINDVITNNLTFCLFVFFTSFVKESKNCCREICTFVIKAILVYPNLFLSISVSCF